MEESDYLSSLLFIIFLILCILMVYQHREGLDEFGRDSYDISMGIAGRDRWGYILNEDGTLSFWDNLFDMNPYYAW